MKLLLVEDEVRLAKALAELLRREGYEVDHCADGLSGRDAVESGTYDAIILDVMLPGIDGFAIAREARRAKIKTPILMLTAKGELDDKVTGLDSGADDYLTKPFQSAELLARLRALLRRNLPTDDGSLSFGDIALKQGTARLTCVKTGQEVRLGEKEYRLLEYLIANQGQILTREQIAVRIWGYDSDAEYNNVEVYVSFTRKKLHFVGAETEIKAVRGVGYELRYRHV
ncbi:MAG: response regulator transcription factor [Bacillota bacterium]|jgi:DNA-binding response OmpR family regulator